MVKTVSLETAKALKEAGFRQDTEIFWEYIPEILKPKKFNAIQTNRPNIDNEYYAAPTTDELLEELPRRIRRSKCVYWIQMGLNADQAWVEYHNVTSYEEGLPLHFETNKELCEALAACWLWLKKENLLAPDTTSGKG